MDLSYEHQDRPFSGITREWCRYSGGKVGLITIMADSLYDLVSYVTSGEGVPAEGWNPESGSRQDASEAWDLNVGWAGIVRYAEEGWPEGRRQFASAMAQLPTTTGPGLVSYDDVAGGALCVPTYVAGDPAHFTDDPDEEGQAKIVRLLVPLSIHCGIDAKWMMNRGIAICSAVDALEAQGMQCEVECYSGHDHQGSLQVVIRHRVKRAGEHLNPEMLATSIGHPATFRRINFAAMESLHMGVPGIKTSPLEMKSNYGRPWVYPSECIDETKGLIHLPRMPYDCAAYKTIKGAYEETERHFTLQGCTLKFS